MKSGPRSAARTAIRPIGVCRNACADADRHRRGQHAIGRLVAPHHPHDAENDGEDRLPGREHHRQGDEQQRSQIVARAQQLVRADTDAVEKARDRAPDEQPDRNGRWRRRAAARPGSPQSAGVLRSGRLAAGSRRLSRITTPLTVTSTPLVKRGRNTDQARRGLAGRANELSGEARRIVHRIPQRGEIRQRHRALDAGLGQRERRDLILRGRSGKRLQQRQDAGGRDQRLQQQVLDQAGRLQPPPFAGRQCSAVASSSWSFTA